MAATMVEQTRRKALDPERASAMTERLHSDWPEIVGALRPVMRPFEELYAAMTAAGCQRTGVELGLRPEFYRDAVRFSRFTRDRFTTLDVAGDSGQLEAFAASCE